MGQLVLSIQLRDFFNKEGFLELENLLSEYELAKLHATLRIHLLSLTSGSAEKVIRSFRNLSKQDPLIKALVLKNDLAQMALDLTRSPMLRFGLDQLVTPSLIPFITSEEFASVDELFSIQDQTIGLLINLSKTELKVAEEDSCLMPLKPGSGMFFTPKFPLDFRHLAEDPDAIFLLMTYASPKARYKMNPKDLGTHDVKREGKAFGDLLADAYHPLLTKSSLQ